MGAFLTVERSLTGRRWVGPDIEVARQSEALAQATGASRSALPPQAWVRLGGLGLDQVYLVAEQACSALAYVHSEPYDNTGNNTKTNN